MSYYIPMSDILYSVDGATIRTLDRVYPLIDKQAMKSMVDGKAVVFWYDSSIFEVSPVDQREYLPAYEQMMGSVDVTSVVSLKPPEGRNPATPSLLIDSYVLTQMSEMNKYDVILFCVSGNHYQVPSNRRFIQDPSDMTKGTCLVGSYCTNESRTNIIELASSLQLTLLVIRAMRMDTPSSSYYWEGEWRVPCIHL